MSSRHEKETPLTVVPAKAKTRGPDCAYCRSSVFNGRNFECRLNLLMDAKTCSQFRDSREPSRLGPNAIRFPDRP